MKKRLTSLFVGSTLASLGIACVINSNLGCFALTAANLSLVKITGLSLGTVGMLVDLSVLLTARKLGEGIGLASIVNATYCSYMIDFFAGVLPVHPLIAFGLVLAPLGWSFMGRSGFGDTATNLLMNALLKRFGNRIGLIRCIQECLYLAVGFIAAREHITWFTFLLTFGLGYLMQIIYKLVKYDPTKIKHKYFL